MILMPLVMGWLTNDNFSRVQYRYVIIITSALLVTGTLFYASFASAEEQGWGNDNISDENETPLLRTE